MLLTARHRATSHLLGTDVTQSCLPLTPWPLPQFSAIPSLMPHPTERVASTRQINIEAMLWEELREQHSGTHTLPEEQQMQFFSEHVAEVPARTLHASCQDSTAVFGQTDLPRSAGGAAAFGLPGQLTASHCRTERNTFTEQRSGCVIKLINACPCFQAALSFSRQQR